MREAYRAPSIDLVPFFKVQRKLLRPWLSFASDLSKVSTLLSVPIGLFMLVAYLHLVGSPMLVPDTSTVLMLVLIVAAYGSISGLLLACIYAPAFLCYVRRRQRYLIKTKLHLLPFYSESKLLKLLNCREKRKNHSEYLVFHGTRICVFFGFSYGTFVYSDPKIF